MVTDAELEGLAADTSKKQRIYESQEFSQEDIQRIKMERQALQRQTENMEQENQELDKQMWQAEMTLSKLHDKVSFLYRFYSKFPHFSQIYAPAFLWWLTTQK